ncbi:MAG: GtrA family protein [Bacteroidetes bacterium]|nr:GtrA family protein [Bacteroidota bacterium]MBI3481983.1 GtrA family protein [Bacteroidota bacterium]
MQYKTETIFGKLAQPIGELLKWQFTRYIIVGVLSAVLELSLLILLVEVFGIPYLRGNIAAFFVIQMINYILSRHWVFQTKGSKKRIEFPISMFFVICGFLINQTGLWFFTDKLGMNYEISKIIAIALVVIWNFVTRKLIVFKKI